MKTIEGSFMCVAGQSDSLQQSFYKNVSIEQHCQNQYLADH